MEHTEINHLLVVSKLWLGELWLSETSSEFSIQVWFRLWASCELCNAQTIQWISTAGLWRGDKKSSVLNIGTCHYQSLGSLMYQSQTLSTGGWLLSVLGTNNSSALWMVKKNCEMRNMEKEEHSVSSLGCFSSLQQYSYRLEKSTRCWPGWLRAGKLPGSRSSEGIWLRFCREKHERKIMWNKMMLGRRSGWSGWGEHKNQLNKHSCRTNNEQKIGKNIKSLSPLQFNFFTVWWWGLKPKHEWVNAAHCMLLSGCLCAADTMSKICDFNVLSPSRNRWSKPEAEQWKIM